MQAWVGVLVVTAVAALAGLGGAWRAAAGRARSLRAELDAALDRADGLATELEQTSRVRKRQAEELAELRHRSEKARRRRSRTNEPPLGTAARMRDQEERVARVERERDRAERAGERARAEAESLADEVKRLGARLDEAGIALEAARAAPPETAAVEQTLGTVRAALEASEERARTLEQTLAARDASEARLRKRIQNQEQLYASLRAELEAKKDRLRTQEEQLQRLQALKVAVLD
jgi:colicin import membrane protein